MSITCSNCGSKNTSWRTEQRQVPVDVLTCTDCTTVLAEEDWDAPTSPLDTSKCINCQGTYHDDECVRCGLTAEDGIAVHYELRDLVDPSVTPIEAARTSAREGRHLIALKLATMAVYKGDFAAAERGRALRVHLLASMEGPSTAREEAELWVKNVKPAPAIAWALLGKQRFACDAFGSAIAAYQEALKIDPNQATVRIRCAELLMKVGREGQAGTELLHVFGTSPDERIMVRATHVLEQLVATHASNYRDDQVEELLKQFASIVPKSAGLLIHRARIAAIDGNKKQAEADFARAQKLEPNRDDYAKLQRLLKPERSSWWQW